MPEPTTSGRRARPLRTRRVGGRLILLAALLGTVPHALAARPVPPGVDPARVEVAARAILCDCGCHPQSVHDCACGRADEMWSELAAEVASGGPGGTPLSGEAVIAKWVAERGEVILVAPEASGFNLVAWLGPSALFLAAATALVVVLRRWSGARTDRSDPEAAHADADGSDVDPAVLDRIRRGVEELR